MTVKTKLKVLYFTRQSTKIGFVMIQTILIVLVIAQVFNRAMEYRETLHCAFTDSDISYEISNIPMNQYDIQVQPGKGKRIDNSRYLQVDVSGYQIYVDEDIYTAVVGENDVIHTELSVLTISGDSIFAEEISFVNVSAFGQEAFSEESVIEYLDFAKKYYTHNKYTLLGYKDATDYTVTMPLNMQ